MTTIPPKSPLSLVKSDEQDSPYAYELNNIKYRVLFSQVMKSCQSLEKLQKIVDGHSEILQGLLNALAKG